MTKIMVCTVEKWRYKNMETTTKKCPTCGEEIKLEARMCRFCGARFMVRETGYCKNCHRLVNVTPFGRCFTCDGELTDRHFLSSLIANTSQPAVPEPDPVSESKPVSRNGPPASGMMEKPPLTGLFSHLPGESNKGSVPGGMNFQQLYLLPQGRIDRRTFLLDGLLPLALLFTLYIILIISFASYGGKVGVFWSVLIGLIMLVTLWVILMLLVKRFHDLNKSGWVTLYWVVPYFGITLFSMIAPTAAVNAASVYGLISVAISIIFLVQLCRCMFIKGDPLPNKYGQDSQLFLANGNAEAVKGTLFRRRMLIATMLAIVLLPLAFFSVIRYFIDQNNLGQGLAAFEQADCIKANGYFDKIILSWRFLDFGSLRAQAQARQESCQPYLAAVEKEGSGQYSNALSAFADLALSDSTAPSLVRASRQQIGSLFEAHQASELSTLETCERMPEIQSAGMIPQPEIRLPELYFACAVAYKTGNRDNEAVNLHRQLLVEFPNHARAHEAEKALLSNPSACEQVHSLASEPTLSTRGDFIVRLYYSCGQMYDQAKENSKSFEMFKQVLLDHPDHALATQAETALFANLASCENLDALQKESVITTRTDFMPSLLFHCGQRYENEQQYQSAVDMYERFMANYPDHALAVEVNTALARSMVHAARASGAGEISAPSRSGRTSKGSTQVVIQNDSPEKLRLVFSGPEALIVDLAACDGCTTYMITPFSCPEMGPIGRYTLQPGNYDVLVESISDSGVTPYTGSWELKGGDEYSSCFFIIQQYQFTP
jgi:uncharacterized membrane protein YhaH (DUF805 family)/tetratricopeptide (TPR) repeat protein